MPPTADYEPRLLAARPYPPLPVLTGEPPTEEDRQQTSRAFNAACEAWDAGEDALLARAVFETSRVVLSFDEDRRHQIVEMLAIVAPDVAEAEARERDDARKDRMIEAVAALAVHLAASMRPPAPPPPRPAQPAPCPGCPPGIVVTMEQISKLRTTFGDHTVASVLEAIGIDPRALGIEPSPGSKEP